MFRSGFVIVFAWNYDNCRVKVSVNSDSAHQKTKYIEWIARNVNSEWLLDIIWMLSSSYLNFQIRKYTFKSLLNVTHFRLNSKPQYNCPNPSECNIFVWISSHSTTGFDLKVISFSSEFKPQYTVSTGIVLNVIFFFFVWISSHNLESKPLWMSTGNALNVS